MVEPDIRIGTEEREHALEALSTHFTAGRLTLVEFEDRSGLVTLARTHGDLDAVFSDLPRARADLPAAPAGPKAAAPRPPGWEWRAAIVAVMPILAVGLYFMTDTWLWFLMIPATAALLYGSSPAHWPGHERGKKGR